MTIESDIRRKKVELENLQKQLAETIPTEKERICLMQELKTGLFGAEGVEEKRKWERRIGNARARYDVHVANRAAITQQSLAVRAEINRLNRMVLNQKEGESQNFLAILCLAMQRACETPRGELFALTNEESEAFKEAKLVCGLPKKPIAEKVRKAASKEQTLSLIDNLGSRI